MLIARSKFFFKFSEKLIFLAVEPAGRHQLKQLHFFCTRHLCLEMARSAQCTLHTRHTAQSIVHSAHCLAQNTAQLAHYALHIAFCTSTQALAKGGNMVCKQPAEHSV